MRNSHNCIYLFLFNSGTETAPIISWFKTFCTFLTFKRSKVPSMAPLQTQLEPQMEILLWFGSQKVCLSGCVLCYLPLQPHLCSLHSHLAVNFTFTPLFTRHYCLTQPWGTLKTYDECEKNVPLLSKLPLYLSEWGFSYQERICGLVFVFLCYYYFLLL